MFLLNYFIAILCLAWFLPAARAYQTPALPQIPKKVFSVTNYGALGDGVATNTEAIQSAINAASAAGGGVVQIPAGIYLCGPIQLASKINLRLEAGALLRMLPLGKYPGGTVNPQTFISGDNLRDVDRKSTRLNSSHGGISRMPSSA